MKLEEFEKEAERAFVRYHNKYFAGKDVEDAVNETIKSSILKLSAIYCQFDFLRQSLDFVLNHDKNVSQNLSEAYKKQIKYNIETAEIIWDDLDRLLKIVADRITK